MFIYILLQLERDYLNKASEVENEKEQYKFMLDRRLEEVCEYLFTNNLSIIYCNDN